MGEGGGGGQRGIFFLRRGRGKEGEGREGKGGKEY